MQLRVRVLLSEDRSFFSLIPQAARIYDNGRPAVLHDGHRRDGQGRRTADNPLTRQHTKDATVRQLPAQLPVRIAQSGDDRVEVGLASHRRLASFSSRNMPTMMFLNPIATPS